MPWETVPVQEKTRTVVAYSGVKSTNGNNVVIAAPAAGSRLCIISYRVQNISSVSTTAKLTAGADGAEIDGLLLPNQGTWFGDGVFDGALAYRLPEATALVLNLDGANSHGVSVKYFTEVI
jgi:hypothetical protein